MQIPGGKIVKTLFGSPDAPRSVFEELKGKHFDGYIKTSLLRGATMCEGYILLEKGDIVLAQYEAEEKIQGYPALEPIIRDMGEEECIIEVHSYAYKSSSISPRYVMRRFLSAVIESEAVDLEHLLQTVQIKREEERAMDVEREKVREEMPATPSTPSSTYEVSVLSRDEELRRLREELESVKQGTVALLKHFTSGAGLSLIHI